MTLLCLTYPSNGGNVYDVPVLEQTFTFVVSGIAVAVPKKKYETVGLVLTRFITSTPARSRIFAIYLEPPSC